MNEKENPGALFIVATPIGNLEDITLRALRVLREADLIAAEDTRKTRKLLSAYDIHRPLVSLYDQVERQKSSVLISRLLAGKKVAYVSEAGTPGISDPGYVLINAAIENGIDVVPIPGPSAVVAALSASGLPMNAFVFLGFPPTQVSKRRKYFESLRHETRTAVIYESPRRVVAFLSEMFEIIGNRKIVVSRELTKVHEEMLRGDLQGVLERLKASGEIKGEVTVIVGGAAEDKPEYSEDDILSLYSELAKNSSMSTRDIVLSIAQKTGIPKKRVYSLITSRG
jgi:16S rRNA (cytidine1402-2'-O)-methyltransferase